MDAWIIVIGDEILIGRILDTNSNWLAKKLTSIGINVKRILVIPDDEDVIIDSIRQAIDNTDIIITTGGLGPTYDDKTSQALSKALQLNWVLNEDALEMVKERLKKFNLSLNEYRIKMAKMPENAEPLKNEAGVAPGIHIKYNGKEIFTLPGVPNEMKNIYENQIEKYLINNYGLKYFYEETIRIEGYPESTLAPLINELALKYKELYIKSHPRGIGAKGPIIDIAFSTNTEKPDEAKMKCIKAINELKERIKEIKKI